MCSLCSGYEAAKPTEPGTLVWPTQNWTPMLEVWLNPPKGHQAENEQDRNTACSLDTTTYLTNTDTLERKTACGNTMQESNKIKPFEPFVTR